MAVNTSMPAPPLRRDPAHGALAGVCAGIGNRLGIDPVIVRVCFVAAALSGGLGVLLYALAWVLLPVEGTGESVAMRVRDRRASWETALGAALVMLSVLLVFRELGVWFSDAI